MEMASSVIEEHISSGGYSEIEPAMTSQNICERWRACRRRAEGMNVAAKIRAKIKCRHHHRLPSGAVHGWSSHFVQLRCGNAAQRELNWVAARMAFFKRSRMSGKFGSGGAASECQVPMIIVAARRVLGHCLGKSQISDQGERQSESD